MKDQATHIRLIREKGKPVEIEYHVVEPFRRYRDQIAFRNWAEANRIPVTGDWPTDKNVFAKDEMEEVWVISFNGGKTWHVEHEIKMRDAIDYIVMSALRLKAKQEDSLSESAGNDQSPVETLHHVLQLLKKRRPHVTGLGAPILLLEDAIRQLENQ